MHVAGQQVAAPGGTHRRHHPLQGGQGGALDHQPAQPGQREQVGAVAGLVHVAPAEILAGDARRGKSISPATEWLHDNFHLVENELREIRHHLHGTGREAFVP